MTIVDPLATPEVRAAAAADRSRDAKKAASLRMIIVDLPEVRVAAGADRVGMKKGRFVSQGRGSRVRAVTTTMITDPEAAPAIGATITDPIGVSARSQSEL